MSSFSFSEDFIKKLETFNEFYDDKPSLQLQAVKVEGEMVLEGQLRIYWGIVHPILFKEKDDEESPSSLPQQRHSYSPAVTSFVDSDILTNNNDALKNGTTEKNNEDESKSPFANVVLRSKRRRRKTRKRLSVINGHLYNTETGLFKPPYGTLTAVTITSQDTTQKVIKALLDKFKVENHPIEFCLCLVRSSGETRALKDVDRPLLERLRSGPLEDEMKIFIMEKYRLIDISEEVAHFFNLPDAVLFGFLDKYMKDEEMEKELIRERYRVYRDRLEQCLDTLSPHC